jgi:hypothetical protein
MTTTDPVAVYGVPPAAAILYGKGVVSGLIPAWTGVSLRSDAVYGVLSWRAMWNARHISDRGRTLHAINRVPIRGVDMACNTTEIP